MISKMSGKFQYNDGYGTKHTQSPISTGTSVIGLAYDKGVIIAADDLASYGSLARFRNVLRVSSVNNKIALGCTGDYADYQYMMKSIEDLINSEYSYEDNHEMSPQALHTWLTRVQYSQRSDFEPLWCKWVIGGLDHQGKPYLGYTDMLGTAYASPMIATGFGAYLAMPMLRSEYEAKNGQLTEDQARSLIVKCLQVLYYRDARSFNQYHLAIVNETGSKVEGPFKLTTNWDFAHMVTGYE